MATKIKILLVILLMTGILSGLGMARFLLATHPAMFCGSTCQNAVTPDRRFFSDELILYGKTEDQKPFLLYLDLNRKKIIGSYTHYYYADFVFGDQRRQLYTDFVNDSEKIQPRDFLSSFSSGIAKDLSSRENYEFNFNYKDLHIKADLKNFNGDFIVKNTIDYTKYVSEGDGQVEINGKTYIMHAMVNKIYTPFYDKYVFFKGYNTLSSLAQFLALWDEEDNFYVLDDSRVEDDLPEYKSHTWVLYKNKQGGFVKKAFSANVQADQNKFVPQKWSVYIPGLNFNMELSPSIFITTKEDTGLVSGTITTPQGTQTIKGYFSFRKYGK